MQPFLAKMIKTCFENVYQRGETASLCKMIQLLSTPLVFSSVFPQFLSINQPVVCLAHSSTGCYAYHS